MAVVNTTNVTAVPLGQLILQPGLEGQLTSEAIALAELLLRGLGQLAPVMARSDYMVYFNTATVIAARRLGWAKIGRASCRERV